MQLTDKPISETAQAVAAAMPAPANVPSQALPAVRPFDWAFAVSAKRGPGSLHHLLAAVKKMRRLIAEGAKPFCLTLAGPSGVGKTHLAKAFHQSLVNCGFVSWPSWCIQGFTEQNIGYLRGFRFPLVIDEAFIATGGRSDVRTATQESRALVSVLEARADKWTLLTTNASLAQIQAQDERLYSRLIRHGSFAIEVDTDTPDFSTLEGDAP